jgi:hypothetical protein
MKRDLSALEQNLVSAMEEHAHRAAPPAFDPSRIIAGERRRLRMRISLAAVSLATAAGIAACVATTAGAPSYKNKVPVVGGTHAPAPATTATTPAPGTPSSPAATSPSPHVQIPSWPTAAASSPFTGSVPPVPVLAAVRTGAHPEGGYDRISFEFTGQVPGYSVAYVQQVVRSGSGAAVQLPGSAFLQLTFRSAQAHDVNGVSTLGSGALNPVTVGDPELRAYVVTGDFEGVVGVALGLAAADGFHVSELTKSPTDHVISVDIARPGP